MCSVRLHELLQPDVVQSELVASALPIFPKVWGELSSQPPQFGE